MLNTSKYAIYLGPIVYARMAELVAAAVQDSLAKAIKLELGNAIGAPRRSPGVTEVFESRSGRGSAARALFEVQHRMSDRRISKKRRVVPVVAAPRVVVFAVTCSWMGE